MGSSGCSLLCFWGTIIAATHAVGPCLVSEEQVFNCSQKNLRLIPPEIYDNVTILDLSQNALNLSDQRNLQQLQRFRSLVFLNLSGNFLPLLERETFDSLRNLHVLDLSGCHLGEIKAGAFRGLPKLQTLNLSNNKLWGPLPSALSDLSALSLLDLRYNRIVLSELPSLEWLKGVRNVLGPGVPSDGILLRPGNKSEVPWPQMRDGKRKLLVKLTAEQQTTSPANSTKQETQNPPEGSKGGHTWQYLVAVLVSAISVSVLIALAVKFKIFHRYLSSYRHSPLSEADTASHCDPESLEVGQGGTGSWHRSPAPCELEDDDGFIEDNYIQASERERAERGMQEVQGEEEEEEEEEDDQFSIA
ncbi:type III endosome membrane protein TEMP isoform X3 [Amia ocellicauda]|uniref:type III endosome membrane protein TEMP isoform X3 n=1 Tax=Amia ocellicauda TaxID=2972642 RepID=UPI003463D31C